MSDEQTARTILELHGIGCVWTTDPFDGSRAYMHGPIRTCLQSARDDRERLVDAICVALKQAREEGRKQIVEEAGRVSEILHSVNVSNADTEANARFEVDRFAFSCAASIVGSTLTDYQKHALFHQFKNVFDAHESALRQARTPPPGHIIDDHGVVRRVLGTLPITADGCVVGDSCVVFKEDANYISQGRDRFYEFHTGNTRTRSDCWSTREAAQSAKEAK